jgi:hypothetical protein
MAGEGHRTAVVERKLIGGSCPNIACLPSKNIIHSAKVRSFTMRAAEFGVELESAVTSMKGVQARKRAMVDSLRQFHLDRYHASGAELIMGEARFEESLLWLRGPRESAKDFGPSLTGAEHSFRSYELDGRLLFPLDVPTQAAREVVVQSLTAQVEGIAELLRQGDPP